MFECSVYDICNKEFTFQWWWLFEFRQPFCLNALMSRNGDKYFPKQIWYSFEGSSSSPSEVLNHYFEQFILKRSLRPFLIWDLLISFAFMVYRKHQKLLSTFAHLLRCSCPFMFSINHSHDFLKPRKNINTSDKVCFALYFLISD